MSVVSKIVALLDLMTKADLEALPPIHRQQFAERCKHWAKLADDGWTAPQPRFHKIAKSGILPELRQYGRSWE